MDNTAKTDSRRGNKPASVNLMEPASAAASDVTASAPVVRELRKFLVEFRDNPALVIEASNEDEAFTIYKQKCGILATLNKPRVSLQE